MCFEAAAVASAEASNRLLQGHDGTRPHSQNNANQGYEFKLALYKKALKVKWQTSYNWAF